MENTESTLLRRLSIGKGLLIPEHEGHPCICCWDRTKVNTPNLNELELASRPHRFPEVREYQRKYFKALLTEVTEEEIDLLKVLNLPKIEVIRKAELMNTDGESGVFTFNQTQDKEIKAIYNEWVEELLGTRLANQKRVDTLTAVYPYYQLEGFAIGVEDTFNEVIKELPDYLTPDQIEAAKVAVTLQDDYLKAVVDNGAIRLKDKLTVENYDKVRRYLIDAAAKGSYPLDVGRWLHKATGEGEAWYWNRIARSESALGIDAAFDASGKKYGFKYEYWSAASNACPICQQYHGGVWKVGEGPHVVSDTHPHCLCVRRPKYVYDGPVRDRWTRASPYDVPYTQDQLRELGVLFPERN